MYIRSFKPRKPTLIAWSCRGTVLSLKGDWPQLKDHFRVLEIMTKAEKDVGSRYIFLLVGKDRVLNCLGPDKHARTNGRFLDWTQWDPKVSILKSNLYYLSLQTWHSPNIYDVWICRFWWCVISKEIASKEIPLLKLFSYCRREIQTS